MYDNIGKKIKGLAMATFIVVAIASVIIGITLWDVMAEWLCVLILFCGPIVAWVSSWLLYGFGEIIDKLCDIEHNTGIIMKPSKLKKQKEAISEEENAVIIECPECGEELFFDKNLLQAECPYCGRAIKIK